MVELVGSNWVVRRPTDIDLKTASESDTDGALMTIPRAPTEEVDPEPYQTPVALTPANRKNKARAMAEPEDALSDFDVIRLEDILVGKERMALTEAAERVCVC